MKIKIVPYIAAIVLGATLAGCDGGCSKAPEPVDKRTTQEMVAERMADREYTDKLRELQEAQKPLLIQRARVAEQLNEFVAGKGPAQYENDPEFVSLKRRFDDLDKLVEAEKRKALEAIRERISKQEAISK